MHFEIVDNVYVPNQFQDKFDRIQKHQRRIKSCETCRIKFYDVSHRMIYAECSSCRLSTFIKSQKLIMSEEEASGIEKRNKVCLVCDTRFYDLTLPAGRKFCNRCSADYSYDVLKVMVDKRKAAGEELPAQFDITKYHEDIRNMNSNLISDAEISRKLGLLEEQVRFVRKNLGLPTITRDTLREAAGLKCISTIANDDLTKLINEKSYDEIATLFGSRSPHFVKNLRKKLGALPRFTGYKTVDLTHEMEQIMIGHTLGDGCIVLRSSGMGAYFRIVHKYDVKDYTSWSQTKLSTIVNRVINNEFQQFPDYGFSTIACTNLVKLYKQFYKPELKTLDNIYCKCPDLALFSSLSPLALAIWYMDDGTLSSDATFSIACYFRESNYDEICQALSDNFKIKFSWKKPPSSTTTSIRVKSGDKREFFKIIEPFIHPKMSYKLPPYFKRDLSAYINNDELSHIFNVETFRSLPPEDVSSYLNKAIEHVKTVDFPYPDKLINPISHIVDSLSKCEIIDNKLPHLNTSGLDLLDIIFKHRFTSNQTGELSSIDAWHDAKTLGIAFKSLASWNTPIDKVKLRRRVMELCQAPGHFRPGCASALCNEYKPKSVLDMFAGWGGRALGALSSKSVKEYVGIDLQRDTINSLRELREKTQSWTNCLFSVYHGDALEVTKQWSNKFDMVIAGPPYYDVENYNGIVPSCSFSEWKDYFIKPFAERSYAALKSGGVLCLHMFDTHKYQFIEPFIEACLAVGYKYDKPIIYSQLKVTGRFQYVHIFLKG